MLRKIELNYNPRFDSDIEFCDVCGDPEEKIHLEMVYHSIGNRIFVLFARHFHRVPIRSD